jgi:hypothetical protein
MFDRNGRRIAPRFDNAEIDRIRDMFKPVRCTCGQIYDVGAVEVTARYTDCSMWTTPCCKRTADDRGETGWKPIQDYTVIDKETLR